MFGFCLILESGFLLVFGTGLISELSNPAAGKNVYTSRVSTGKPNSCNDCIYHFHVLESLNLDFFDFWGRGEMGYFTKGKLHFAHRCRMISPLILNDPRPK